MMNLTTLSLSLSLTLTFAVPHLVSDSHLIFGLTSLAAATPHSSASAAILTCLPLSCSPFSFFGRGSRTHAMRFTFLSSSVVSDPDG